MESRLTKLEMDAVLQLIQLSSASDCDDDFPVFWVNLSAEEDKKKKYEEDEGGSAGEALSSTSINPEKYFNDEPLPRNKPKFGSLLHIYTKTHPLIKHHAKKRARF